MSFGGSSWPINSTDMNLGAVSPSSSQCVGGIFDLQTGSSIGVGGGAPSWVVGDTFLVWLGHSLPVHLLIFLPTEKCVLRFPVQPRVRWVRTTI